MTTPLAIVSLALKDIGALGLGQTPSAEDTNDAFTKLNWMVAQWARQRLMVWHTVDLSLVSTGAQSYTIGPSGTINVSQRPDKIEAAFLRQTNVNPQQPIDYPLVIVPSRVDYDRITLKNLASFPRYLFYDTAYPLGVLYPWPIPQASIYEVHITVKDILARFTSLTQTISLPPEYEQALEQNLAVMLCPGYSRPCPPELALMAREARNVVMNANVQLATMTMPTGLVPYGGNYNFYSDTGILSP